VVGAGVAAAIFTGTTGTLVVVLAIVIMIMLHELGHFATAKWGNMKVTEYFLGFGPRLWSVHRGETEYGVKAIPAGGFVKIVGMTELEDVDPADEPRSFRNQPGWQRIIVLAAGSFMHFVLALFLLFIVAAGIGLETASAGTTVGTVETCVPANLNSGCVKGDPASPATQAGVKVGDRIVSIGGIRVNSWTQMGKAIRSQQIGREVPVVVDRHGRLVTLHATLASLTGHGSYLGVSPTAVFKRVGPVGSASYAGHEFWTMLSGSASVVATLPKAIPDLFAKNRADTPGGQVTSVVGAGNVTGQVLAAKIGWQPKAALVLLIIASLNIFVGAFNLLPLLPLDGGHLAVVIYERIRYWLARLFRRPDPGPVDYRRLVPLSVGVFALLVGVGLLLIMADLVNPVHLQ
jgi:membrane-associated protease RseP (regulator of RpoE activity)